MTWLEPGGADAAPPALRHYAVPDDLRVVATGLRFPEGPISLDDGSLLVVEVRGEALTRVMPDGRLELVSRAARVAPMGRRWVPTAVSTCATTGGCPRCELSDGVWYPIDAASGTTTPAGYTHGWVERVDIGSGAVERLCGRSATGCCRRRTTSHSTRTVTCGSPTPASPTMRPRCSAASIEQPTTATRAPGRVGPPRARRRRIHARAATVSSLPTHRPDASGRGT